MLKNTVWKILLTYVETQKEDKVSLKIKCIK